MSFFNKVRTDGLAAAISLEWSKLHPDLLAFLNNISKLEPLLTTGATIAETVTGNAELIPLTQAAGTAAANLSGIIIAEQSTSAAAAHLITNLTPVLQAAKVDQSVIDHANKVVESLQKGIQVVPTTIVPTQA
jgi:hypothetical protein